MNNIRVAAALRLLAEAFETPAETPPEQPAETAKPRGRGRPVKGEETAAAPAVATTQTAQATVAAVTASDDPFATPSAPAAPTATLEEVRKALTDLKTAVSQEKALAVLKDAGGAGNLGELKAEKYGAVVKAANEAALLVTKKPVVEEDPFALPSEITAPAAKPLTLEDVKAAITGAQKRTSTDTVQKVLMQLGGKAKNPDTGVEGPNLRALPPDKFAEAIAAFSALPATK